MAENSHHQILVNNLVQDVVAGAVIGAAIASYDHEEKEAIEKYDVVRECLPQIYIYFIYFWELIPFIILCIKLHEKEYLTLGFCAALFILNLLFRPFYTIPQKKESDFSCLMFIHSLAFIGICIWCGFVFGKLSNLESFFIGQTLLVSLFGCFINIMIQTPWKPLLPRVIRIPEPRQ